MVDWEEDRLGLALRASQEGIWDWDLAKKTIECSGRVLRFMGYRRETMPNFFEDREGHMDPESVFAIDEALDRVCRLGEDLFAVEARVKSRNGVWKWFRVRGTPVRDDLGKVIRIVGSIIDISKRMEAEQELAEERAFIRTLMDNVPINVYFKDEHSRFVLANLPTARKMGLRKAEEIEGKCDFDFFQAEFANTTRALEKKVMETGIGLSDITEHEVWKDGHDSWVKTTKHAWLNRDGEVQGIFGVTSDITEMMRAREKQEAATAELQERNGRIDEERRRMRLVIDNVPLNVYFKDRDHQFVITNQSLASHLGCQSPDDLYGKTDWDFFSEEHSKKAEADEDRIMRTGEAIEGKIEKETWSGRGDTWVMSSKYVWRDADGETIGVFGVSSDVSDLMKAQRDLAGIAQTLKNKNVVMQEELNLAREVQLALLPETVPQIEGHGKVVKIAKYYRPAPDLTGDFFEVLDLGNERVGFLICDVIGHGVRSALVVSMLRGLIEKQTESALVPGGFLSGLNEGLAHLLTESGVSIEASAVYGMVDLEGDRICLSVAGHVNPIAVFEDGARQLVPPPGAYGPALGAESDFQYDAVEAPLAGLKRIFCFSDGVRKARNQEGEIFGVARVLEIVERGGSLDYVLEKLSKAVIKFTKGSKAFENAVCLLALEIKR